MRSLLKIPLLCLILIGCRGNNFYYDEKTESVVSCGGKLTSVEIIDVHSKNPYSFKSKDGSAGADTFFLFKENENFELYHFGVKAKNQSIEVLPNTKYIVSNYSVGDAARSRIELETDSLGKIFKASKVTCK